MQPSDPATKNKIFLGFWFVLFAVLILLVNWIFHLPADRAESLLTGISDTERQVTRLTALHAEFLLNNDKEDNVFATRINNTEAEAKQIIIRINENIAILKDRRFVKRNVHSDLENFTEAVQSFETGLTNLILITRERGNQKSGMVSRWLQLSAQMSDASQGTDQDMIKQLHQIRQLESEYLLSRDVKKLQDISMAAEEIRNQITMEEGSIYIDDIDSYILMTGNLASIEKRMGHSGSEGIIPELEKSIAALQSSFDPVKITVQQHVESTGMYWTIGRYTAILFIIGLFIYLFVHVFSLIEPLKQLAGFTKKLAAGEMPADHVEVGNLADMKVVKDSLQKHVLLLQEKITFTQSLNNDALQTKLELAGDNDLLGLELLRLQKKMLENTEKQAKNEQDNLIRRYMNEGLAKFGDIMRTKNDDIHLLGDAFIREMVKYLNAVQGGFFIYDDADPSDPVLNLISAFAYNRKKYLQQSIKFGEGLVGTCAKEKQYVNITEIPEGYISITSGLGDTKPDNLLLVPVLHENEILGVLEIASLRKFENHEIEFATEVALSLGSTLVNTRNNQRTSELLTKSQQQALEMAEQEEEMRQNMEELKATQEESGRREEELQGTSDAAGKAFMILEYSLDGTIIEVNENLCAFLEKSYDEIVGKNHQEVFQGSLNTDANFWADLQRQGYLKTGEKIKSGKNTLEILEHIALIMNRSNQPVKFINFVTDGRIGNS